MKKHVLPALIPSLLALGVLAGCSSPVPEDTSKERVKEFSLIGPNDEGEVGKLGVTFHLLFKASSDIPYISMKEGFGLLNAVKASRYNDPAAQRYFYRLNGNEKRMTIENEVGAKCVIDTSAQTVAYSDFDSFASIVSKDQKPLMIYAPADSVKAIKPTKVEFAKGKEFTVDLKPYSRIDAYGAKGDVYLPLNTFNDLFVNPHEYLNLAYNQKDVFLIPQSGLTMDVLGLKTLNALGEAYFKDAQKETISEEYAEFDYQSLLLNFDNFYGLKKEKFESFDSFLSFNGYKTAMNTTNVKALDAATWEALTYLRDGHTAQTVQSPLYEFGAATKQTSKMDQEYVKWVRGSDALQEKRTQSSGAPLGNSLDEAMKTYYIAFNEFTAINEDLLYRSSNLIEPSKASSSTALQFRLAYEFLSKAENRSKVDTIVIDLATNDGGASDAMIYSLCALYGEVKTHMANPHTGGKCETWYKADVNVDGKIDEKDVGLASLGYNIVFLNSKYTFSCGNAMPVIAWENNPKTMTVGETSGGGTCVVRPFISPIGGTYSVSGTGSISVVRDGKYVNIEKGIAAEHAVEEASMFDRAFLSTKIKTWFAERIS